MLYALFQNYQILSLSIVMLIYLIDLNNKHDGFFFLSTESSWSSTWKNQNDVALQYVASTS